MLRKSHCTQCTHNILTHTRTGHKMCNFQRTIQKFANQNKIRTFFRTQHNTRREKEKHIVEYETANRMEMCIIKWKEQCQLCVFFGVLLLLRQSPNSFFFYFRKSFSVLFPFADLSVALYTHYYRGCCQFCLKYHVISFV